MTFWPYWGTLMRLFIQKRYLFVWNVYFQFEKGLFMYLFEVNNDPIFLKKDWVWLAVKSYRISYQFKDSTFFLSKIRYFKYFQDLRDFISNDNAVHHNINNIRRILVVPSIAEIFLRKLLFIIITLTWINYFWIRCIIFL